MHKVGAAQDTAGLVKEFVTNGCGISDIIDFFVAAGIGYSTDSAGGNAGELAARKVEEFALKSKVKGLQAFFAAKHLVLGALDARAASKGGGLGDWFEALLHFSSGFTGLAPRGLVSVSKSQLKSLRKQASTNFQLSKAAQAAADKGDDAAEALGFSLKSSLGDKKLVRAYKDELKLMKAGEHDGYNQLLAEASKPSTPQALLKQAGINFAHGTKSTWGSVREGWSALLGGTPTYA